MRDNLVQLLHQANPWVKDKNAPIQQGEYIPRLQTEKLLSPEWDS